jgi:hypothetical protein
MKHFLLALLLCFSFGTFANSATPPGDEDIVVYQTVMPSETNSIVLPSTLSGDYQIQLLWDGWMLYGWINL